VAVTYRQTVEHTQTQAYPEWG